MMSGKCEPKSTELDLVISRMVLLDKRTATLLASIDTSLRRILGHKPEGPIKQPEAPDMQEKEYLMGKLDYALQGLERHVSALEAIDKDLTTLG